MKLLHQIKNHPFDYNIDQVDAFPMPSFIFIFQMNSYTTECIILYSACKQRSSESKPPILSPPPAVGDHTTPINPKAKMLNRALFLLNFVGFLPA